MISGWTVGQQIEHVCMTIVRVHKELFSPASLNRKTHLKPLGRAILTVGRIPRGRGKAPAVVRPSDGSTTEQVQAVVLNAKASGAEVANAPEAGTFDHPIFGVLDKKRAIRFLEVHTDHHIRIIKDILDAR